MKVKWKSVKVRKMAKYKFRPVTSIVEWLTYPTLCLRNCKNPVHNRNLLGIKRRRIFVEFKNSLPLVKNASKKIMNEK
jgi:hypothetical protein